MKPGGHSRREDERGAAILMVVIVLAALTIVGAPFALSMHLQLRASRHFRADAQARMAAEGALAHAISSLYRTTDACERSRGALPPFNTPEYDTRAELDATLDPRSFTKKGARETLKALGVAFNSVRDGVFWHVAVEDEQGKVNLASAPPALVGNLLGSATLTARMEKGATEIEVSDTLYFPADDDPRTVDGQIRIGGEVMTYSDLDDTRILGVTHGSDPTPHGQGSLVYLNGGAMISNLKIGRSQGQALEHPFRTVYEAKEVIPPEEFERIERFVTVHSHREAGPGWVRRERLIDNRIQSDTQTFRVKDNSNFGPGTAVRFLQGSRILGYGRVDAASWGSAGAPTGQSDWFKTEAPLGADVQSDELYAEAELRHPINVNTAPRRVLAAVFKGVSYRGTRDSVSGLEAEILADRFMGRSVRNEDDFRAALDEAVTAQEISPADRTALLENATAPNSTKLTVSTTTICYKTYGTYAIEAAAFVSDPAGNEVARRRIREIVSIPEESPGTFTVRSQKEFEDQMAAGFGRKVVTWPNLTRDPSVSPDESVDDDMGDVRLDPSEAGNESTGKATVEHFRRRRGDAPVSPDGASLRAGGSVRFPSGLCFEFQNGLMSPGYFEMWVRPLGQAAGPLGFFGCGEEDTKNNVSFYYDPQMQELVLVVADSCMENRAAEYRYPFTIEHGEWYHVAAAWKGTQYGQQSIRVDGHAWGEGRTTYRPGSRLVGDLSETDNSVLVEDTSDFLPYGAVQIDQEIIDYQSKTDTSLEGCRRGARYSAFAQHRADAMVVPYGYSNDLAQDLPLVRGLVSSDFGANPSTKIDKPGSPGPPPDPGGIDDIVVKIPVKDTSDFQDSGFLRIDNEIVYYGKKEPTAFNLCVRGMAANGPPRVNTKAMAHADGRTVSQISLRVTDHSGYADSGYVSVGAPAPEWIEYNKKVSQDGRDYLMPWTRYTASTGVLELGGFRNGFGGTSKKALSDGSQVIPVVRMQKSCCGDNKSPDYEEVTVADLKGNAELRRITHAHNQFGEDRHQNPPGSGPWIHDSWWHAFWVSLDDFTSRTYTPGEGGRILKFPSGELPAKVPGECVVGADRRGANPVRGYIDEVKFTRGDCQSGCIPRDHGINATDQTITVVPFGRGVAFPNTGVIKIADEFIYYDGTSKSTVIIPAGPPPDRTKKLDNDPRPPARVDVVNLSNCTRGILGGGNPVPHDEGSPVTFCDEYPVTTLAGPMPTSASDSIPLNDGRLFPQEGYALIDTELISWTKKLRDQLTGCTPFRGAFGTPAGSHAGGRIVQSMPFRYWDRYSPECDSGDMAYFQVATTVRDAMWRSISWDDSAPDGLGAGAPILIRCVVRFDGSPAWDSKITNEPGGLWEFTRPGINYFAARGSRSAGVKADQVEARFYFDYQHGSYGLRSHFWKRTPLIDSIQINYASPLIVRMHEEIED